MQRAPQEVLEALKEFDSATVFNAVVESMGATQGGTELEGKGGVPENYTGPEVRCLLPELGTAVGYAATAELTTNDPDSEAIPMDEYHDLLDRMPAPIVAVIKDVDTRPGRGACFGDGMAALYKALGATGAIVEGTVRDLAGIKAVGLPTWGTGRVPGHGVFNLIRINASVTIAQLRIHPGDLLIADGDGCTKIPQGHDPEEVLRMAGEIRKREQDRRATVDDATSALARWRERQRK